MSSLQGQRRSSRRSWSLKRRSAVLAAVGAVGLLPSMALGATWSGGSLTSSNWSDSANWDLLPNPGDPLIFDTANRLTNTNDFADGTAFASITFASGAGAFTLNQATTNGIVLTGGAIANNSTNLQTINIPLTLAAATTVSVVPGGSVRITQPVLGGQALNLNGGGTLRLTGTNAIASHVLDGGTLIYTADNTIGNLTFGAANGNLTNSTLDLSSANLTATNLSVVTGSTTPNVVTIGAGKTLALTSATIGVGNQANTSPTLINFGGGGALTVAGTGTAFSIAPESNTTANSVTVDMSGLNSFTYTTNSTGEFRLAGGAANTTGDRSNGILTLPGAGASPSASITAGTATFGGGSNSNGGTAALHLGAGTNTVNANTIRIGLDKASTTIDFATATGSLKIRGFGGTDSDRAAITIGSRGQSGTATPATAVNLAGHSVDILASNLIIGQSTNSSSGRGSLTFDTGTIDATSVLLGNRTNGTANGSITIGGTGLLKAGNITLTDSASNTSTGVLTINGGTVRVTTGDIAEGTNKTGLSTLVLSGGVLDLGGHNIGSGSTAATGAIDTLTLQSGTLKNVNQINGGVNNLNLTASGTDTLTLDGTNAFSNPITVNGGTVRVGSGGATGTLGSGAITNNGILAFNRTGSLSVANAISGAGSVQQNGAGTITFTNASLAYTGTTDINNGTLSITGALAGGGAVNVNATATTAGTLSGTGSITGPVILTANNGSNIARIAPGATSADGSTGTLTLANLTVNGGDLRFDVGADLLNVTGSANFAGAATISPTAGLAAGTYTVLTAGSLNLGVAPTIVQPGGRSSFALDTSTPNTLKLVVTGIAGNLIWVGNLSGAWDINNTQNWNSGVADKYFEGDAVTFNNSGVTKNVTLNATVHPSSVTVNNSGAGNDYSITGTGGIAGATGLIKTGTATLTLGGTDTFTGATLLQQGTLKLATATALSPASALTIGGASTSGILDLNGNNATVASLSSGATGAANIIENKGATAATLTVAGGNTTFAGTIQDDAPTALAVTNGAALKLTATNTYSGGTTISGGGTVEITSLANLGSGSLTLDNGTLRLATGAGNVDVSTRTITLNAGGGTFNTNGNDVTFTVPFGNGGAGGFTKTGAGTLTFTLQNSYTGGTTVTAGTLALASGELLNDAAPLTVNGGRLNLGTNTETVGAVTLDGNGVLDSTGGTLSGTSFALNSGTVNVTLTGTGALTKSTAGTVTLNALNTRSGATTLDGGTLVYGAGADGTNVNALTFGAASLSANTSNLDLTNASINATSLNVRTGSATANVITLGAGKTLTVTSGLTVGNITANGALTTLQVTGASGTLAVTGGNLTVGNLNAGALGTLDLSGLGTFTYTNAAGTINIANGNVNQGDVELAANSTLTAATLLVGGASGSNGGIGTLHLGSGANVINATTINVGIDKSTGIIGWQPAVTTGTLKIRGVGGTDTDRATITIGNRTESGTATTADSVNLAGHSVDILAGTLIVARNTNSSTETSSLAFDTGTIDANSVIIAQRTNGTAIGTLTVGGTATLRVGSGGFAVSDGGTSASSGTLNVNGGTVTTISDIVDGLTQSGGGVSKINLTAGVIDLTGQPGVVSPANLGSPSSPIDNLTISGGSLRNFNSVTVASLGGSGGHITGAPGVAAFVTAGGTANSQYDGVIEDGGSGGTVTFVKQGAGTLTLTGANTYTGTTTVQAGTLRINGTHTPAGVGAYTVAPGATLGGTGTTTASVTIQGTGILAPGSGGIGTLTTGDLLVDAATLSYDFGAPGASAGAPGSSDVAASTGLLTFNNPSTLNLADAGGLAPGFYKLFSYNTLSGFTPTDTTTATTGSIAIGTSPLVGDDYSITSVGNAIVLHIIFNGVNQWTGPAGGDWATASNWTGGVAPSNPGDVARFLGLGAPPVSLAADHTVGSVLINTSTSYSLTGAGAVVLDSGGAGAASITAQGNVSHAIQNVRLVSGVDVSVDPSTTLVLGASSQGQSDGSVSNAAGATINKLGDGTLRITGAQTHGNTATLNASAGTTVLQSDAGSDNAYKLAVNVTPASGSSVLHIGTSATDTTHLRSLLLNTVGNGGNGEIVLDVALTGAGNNVTHFGAQGGSVAVYVGDGAGGVGIAPRAVSENLWKSAALEGYWALRNGLGGLTAITRGLTMDPALPHDNTSINGLVVMTSVDGAGHPVTYVGENVIGDVNGDAHVDVNDVTQALAHLGKAPGTVAGEAGYTVYTPSEGDVNGDLTVDVNDITAILSNLNKSYTPAQSDGGVGPISAVPEPASAGLLALGAIALLRRRRRAC